MTNRPNEEIAERIMKLMEAKELNANSIAKRCGVYPNIFYSIQQGKNSASTLTIQRILNAFPDVSPEWLYFGKGTMLRKIDNSNPQISPDFISNKNVKCLEAKIQALNNEIEELRQQRDLFKQSFDNLNKTVQQLIEKLGPISS